MYNKCISKVYTVYKFYLCAGCTCGEVRLRGGENYFEGRVEVCFEGQWNTVVLCDDSWSDPDAQVVCSQIGFFSPGECR